MAGSHDKPEQTITKSVQVVAIDKQIIDKWNEPWELFITQGDG